MEPEAQAGKRSLEDRDLEDDREEKCNEVYASVYEIVVLMSNTQAAALVSRDSS